MSNENATVCGCGVVVDPPKRNGPRKYANFISKTSRFSKGLRRQQTDQQKNDISETGSSSSTEQSRPSAKTSKQEKRLNQSRRTRSAERTESHYTYIDPRGVYGIYREEPVPEALYATIPDTPTRNTNETVGGQLDGPSRPHLVYGIPSMTSPPPTYDVAISKTWQQSGLPPTYEEYLCHKLAVLSNARSHTPPPPWSDSAPGSTTTHHQTRHAAQNNQNHNAESQQYQQYVAQYNRQVAQAREQQMRAAQRSRAMPPRSQSESRAQQQRIATMYEDGAFCMETTALQTAFEHGVVFCSLM